MNRNASTLLGFLFSATSLSSAYANAPRLLEPAAATETVSFEVFVPASEARTAALAKLVRDQQRAGSPDYHKWLTPDQYKARFGTEPSVLDGVAAELTRAGLSVVQTHAHGLRLSGPALAVNREFGADLHRALTPEGHQTLASARPIQLPEILARSRATVMTFRLGYPAHIDSAMRDKLSGRLPALRPDAGNAVASVGPYLVGELKQAYKAPAEPFLNGTGATIGILMCNTVLRSDINAYASASGLPAPNLQVVNVDGGSPFGQNVDCSFEASVDVEQSASMAPGAKIIQYSLPDLSDQSIYDGLTAIVENNTVDVVSMSFGAPEVTYTPAYNGGQSFTSILQAENALMTQGNAQGIAFVTSSGDNGSNPVPAYACFQPGATSACGGFVLSAQFPATSPAVTTVGGVNLVSTLNPPASYSTQIVRQNANPDPLTSDTSYGTPAKGEIWASGGGISIVFAKPSWQAHTGINTKFRSEPDIAGHMGGCPNGAVQPCAADRSSAYVVYGGGVYTGVGTSFSAPDFAGDEALLVQAEGGRVGNLSPLLYAEAAQSPSPFLTGIPGSNGAYTTSNGYNLVLGLGVADFAAAILLGNGPLSGTIGTASNP